MSHLIAPEAASLPSVVGALAANVSPLHVVRKAQAAWARTTIRERRSILRNFRHLLTVHSGQVAALIHPAGDRTKADTLTAEILPLAEATRFLELHAARLLSPQRVSTKGRPIWLGGVRLQVQRDPWGVVLVIGPSNYPLYLPGVQALQAIAAGNAVIWKPGLGGEPVGRLVASLLAEAGLPNGVLTVIDEAVEAAQSALAAGVDKVLITGSVGSGQAVLRATAETLTPVTLELSGCDAMFVLADADVSRAVDALLFGLRLNGGRTCIAPRRVFVHESVADSFQQGLLSRLDSVPAIEADFRTYSLVTSILADALEKGANLLSPEFSATFPGGYQLRPLCLAGANPAMRAMREDIFAPVVSLVTFRTEQEALSMAEQCPYALGATVFGAVENARTFAGRIAAGVVVVNDMIVPTADPRLSFGGRRLSGFGKSRGAEGLLEMTVSKTIAIQTSKRLRHLEAPHPKAAELFSSFLALTHGRGLSYRLRALVTLCRAVTGNTK